MNTEEKRTIGEILKNEYMIPNNLSAYSLARSIGVPISRIQDIIHGRRKITVETSIRLGIYFGVDDKYFLDLQIKNDIKDMRKSLKQSIERIIPLSERKLFNDIEEAVNIPSTEFLKQEPWNFNEKVIFETNRTILREMTDDDFDALKKVIIFRNDDEYIHKWINWCRESYKKYGFGHWAVVLKETGEMIGSCGVSMQLIDGEWKPEIGYHIRKDYHRQGLGKEVAIAIKDYFFTHFDYDEVYSFMDKDNIASYKTAEANGMKFLHFYGKNNEDVYRVYRITRQEWLEKKN